MNKESLRQAAARYGVDLSDEMTERFAVYAAFLREYNQKVNLTAITDPEEIAAFASDVCSQKDPREAGLYDLARKPDGTLENCYGCAVIYGFFEEEPYLAIPMPVTSYNDLAYSVSIGNEEYVLPEEWLQKLREG